MFSPQGYPNGKVVYDFSLSPIDQQLCSLYDLEPYRQTLVVVGVTQYNEDGELKLADAVKTLKDTYPGALVHKVFVFGVTEEIKDLPKHAIQIFSSKADSASEFTLESAMAQLTSDFLAELAVYAISKQFASLKSPAIKELETPVVVSRPGDKPYNTSLKRFQHEPSASSVNLSRQDSVSKSGSISLGLTDRTKSKQRGRMLKFNGNLYLLAGRLSDALKHFADAAAILKSAYDHLWYASSLEAIGVCLVLLSFLEAPVSIPQIALSATANNLTHQNHHPKISSMSSTSFDSTPNLPQPPAPTASTPTTQSNPASTHSSFSEGMFHPTNSHHHQQPSLPHSPSTGSLTTYSSSASSAQAPPLPEFLPELTSAILRYYARSQGSAEESVPQLVYCETVIRFCKLLVVTRLGGGWNGAVLSGIVRCTKVPKNLTRDSPSSNMIASWCNKLYITELSNLPILAQCNIYSGLASIYSSIGLMRKRTFVLREMLVNMIPKIVQSRQQKSDHSTPTPAKSATAPSSSPSSASPAPVNGGFVTLLDGVQENGILSLLDDLCRVYGAGDISAVGCGWSELKISFLKTCISVCESIPDLEGVIQYSVLLLSTSSDSLSRDDQIMYYNTIQKSLDTSRKLGRGDISATYWDPYLVRDIRITPAGPMAPKKGTRQQSNGDGEGQVFLYNPYSAQKQQATEAANNNVRVLVQRERAEFVVKLQNPFSFEVQISEISLLTEGEIELEASSTNIYLPPASMYELHLPAVPSASGTLTILGCRVQVVGCSARDYYLIDKEDLRPEEKVKSIGVSAGARAKELQMKSRTYRKLNYEVIPSMPMMAVKSMSLNQGWLMLLEGEHYVFTLTLSNISSIPVKMVQFHFSDSTTEPLISAINSKELPLNEVYECEYFYYHRKALTWVNNEDRAIGEINPHQTGNFDIDVSGKRGMTNAVITIDYSSDSSGGKEGTVWTRQLTVPINITVNPSIELGSCDILPLQSCQTFKSIMDSSCDISDYVLLVADLRNSWTHPMDVTLWSLVKHGEGQEDEKLVELTETIHPSRTKRFLIPIKWTPLSFEEIERPIPLESRKQYIVDSSVDHGKQMREVFWNRERLLKLIDGKWSASKGYGQQYREGAVELRGLRLSQKMVNVLRMDRISISMHMAENPQVRQVNETTYQVPIDDERGLLKTQITNRGNEPVSGVLRLIPTIRYQDVNTVDFDEINRKVLYNGVLQRPIKNIKPGKTVEISLGVVFISRGEYEWTSIFEISSGNHRLEQQGQRQPMFVKAV
ncbi:hypothetical protein TRICI_001841 [Trichomonascus ciferrii]|uniref:Uncharacterized protein n=1 Tax=Trichomonascus ciferrii TaxID=44093 RepID=A0A642V9R0_9ASCO|nr:hypothetical protein TRICI_001841 [Trichomonascus ciferrii]